jgi:hypothetical protein
LGDDVLKGVSFLQFVICTRSAPFDIFQVFDGEMLLLASGSTQEFSSHNIGHSLLKRNTGL